MASTTLQGLSSLDSVVHSYSTYYQKQGVSHDPADNILEKFKNLLSSIVNSNEKMEAALRNNIGVYHSLKGHALKWIAEQHIDIKEILNDVKEGFYEIIFNTKKKEKQELVKNSIRAFDSMNKIFFPILSQLGQEDLKQISESYTYSYEQLEQGYSEGFLKKLSIDEASLDLALMMVVGITYFDYKLSKSKTVDLSNTIRNITREFESIANDYYGPIARLVFHSNAPLRLNSILFDNKRFTLRSPIDIGVNTQDGMYSLDYEPLGIHAYGSNPVEAYEAFREEFASLWEHIARESHDKLTVDAQRLKTKLEKAVEKVEDLS